MEIVHLAVPAMRGDERPIDDEIHTVCGLRWPPHRHGWSRDFWTRQADRWFWPQANRRCPICFPEGGNDGVH